MNGSGGIGFFVYAYPYEAMRAKVTQDSALGNASRVVIRCLVSGSGWQEGKTFAFPHLTPISIVDNIICEDATKGSTLVKSQWT
mmetsp:Transcript_6595/g.8947  ORF Transcript_6595/g.8947 Transcript_6595/m.8947 type:complete len:84 (+) Transcript_6595:34-285(+)